jgi:hypothetical protein
MKMPAKAKRISVKQIIAEVGGQLRRIAWISFQDDGSISFGLLDRTYISPHMRDRIFVWNAYNRVKIEYRIPSDPSALEKVVNPHFTYHPKSALFHLRAYRDSAIFEAIADVPITLQQDGYMPWLRTISAPITKLKASGPRRDGANTDDIVFTLPVGPSSVRIDLDFIPPELVGKYDDLSCRSFVWNDVGLRLTLSFTYPQTATLWWFHFY